MEPRCSLPPFVLITPARNEEGFIEKTIESMIRQTVLPLKWLIVDDGSSDRTPEIVSRYLPQYPWIEMVQLPPQRDRTFAAKVEAFNAGYERVNDLQYEIIGNFDGDVSFENDHLEFLVRKFTEDTSLEVVGSV